MWKLNEFCIVKTSVNLLFNFFFINYIHQDYPYISIYQATLCANSDSTYWYLTLSECLIFEMCFFFFKSYVFLFSRCAKQMEWQNNLQWRCRKKGKWRSRIVPAPPRRGTTTGEPGATNWTFSCQ